MRRDRLRLSLTLIALLAAAWLAGSVIPGPAVAEPEPHVIDRPLALPPGEPAAPPGPPIKEEEAVRSPDLLPPPHPGPAVASEEWLLQVSPLWEVYQAAVAVDDELLGLARQLEAGETSFWAFALAARRAASRQQDNLRRFSGLALEAPVEAQVFATLATSSLEHRVRAARLAERAALTLSERSYVEALEEHRLAVTKGIKATANLIAFLQQYEIPWPPPSPPR
ncbi:MAG: hypothetical protein RDU89_01905 [bacterium]|nr:hypothetical protein [bacterium]